MSKALIWGAGIAAYVVPAVIMFIYIVASGLDRPFVGALLWPLRIIKMLLGGG